MTNSYYNHTTPIARFTTADANKLNTSLKAIEAGFDKIPSATELNQGSRNYSVATNIGNAYSVTVPFVITSYNAGLQVTFLSSAANGGASTLNVNGVGAVDLKRFDGAALLPGDIRAVSLNTVVFDSATFRLTSMHGASEGIATSSAVSASASAVQAAASASSAANSAASASTSAGISSSASASSIATLTATRFGLRNLLINPLFWMAQRNPTTFSATSGVGTFVRDRWKISGTTASWSISNATISFSSGSLSQVVQGRNLPYTGTYTLSWQGTASGSVNGTPVAKGGQITLPGFANATVTFGPGTLSEPQLEYSPVKTQFEVRPTDIERLLCFQYYQKSYDAATPVGTMTHSGVHFSRALNTVEFSQTVVYLHLPMRAVPTLVIWNPRFSNISGSFDDMETALPKAVNGEVSDTHFIVYAATNNLVIGNRYRFHWTVDAEL